jgi:hypothetical protein
VRHERLEDLTVSRYIVRPVGHDPTTGWEVFDTDRRAIVSLWPSEDDAEAEAARLNCGLA